MSVAVAPMDCRSSRLHLLVEYADEKGMTGAQNDLHREQLDDRFDRLLLVVDAMWELLIEKTDLTNEDLFKRVAEIDMKDGVPDRRYRAQPLECPCGAKFNYISHRCEFCGEVAPIRSLFDLV